MSTLFTIGRHLFRYRAAIAATAFVFLVIGATPRNSIAGHAAMALGLAIRIWGAGYLGSDARRRELHGEYVISNKPFRFLKHPLYVGNLFLVVGVLILYNPPRWMGVLYVGLFLIIYSTILLTELDYLKGKPVREGRYRLKNLKGELSTWFVLMFIYLLYFLLRVFKNG
ncbi:MAG: hypothetical protein JSV53_02365 [candidate division WOR-3 bacterium]|nr:MAG: hypothetical protein JSV53_02365 [candidate division WOR-3 bacterium]